MFLMKGRNLKDACGKVMSWISTSFRSTILDTIVNDHECQGDGFSSICAHTGPIKLVMIGYLGLVAPISFIVGLLILCI